jgi:S1-C subfamily serine protease
MYRMEVPLGAGSGFVWDDRGHIVTNYHVIRNARTAQVAVLTRVFPEDGEQGGDNGKNKGRQSRSESPLLRNKAIANSRNKAQQPPNAASTGSNKDEGVTDYVRTVYKARTVGVDPDKDIAVLKIDAPVFDLIPIAVGESAKLKTGQEALAIGNPYGLDHTLTVGIISGTGREVRSPSGRPISNVIQTDAAINPGNSGGPLLNSSGQLIGMNTAIYSPSGGSAGIGFAIPADTLKFIVETLIRDGRVVRPVIGISYLEKQQAKALGISKGVLILDVPSGSPAYRAGLRGTRRMENGLIELGDIIKQIDNRPIDTETDLFEVLEDYKPGDRIKITVSRVDVESSTNRSNGATSGGEPEFNGGIGRQQNRIKMRDITVTTELKGSQDAAAVNRIFTE